jgi:5-methylcytosine-specific restriction endonuclease McrA
MKEKREGTTPPQNFTFSAISPLTQQQRRRKRDARWEIVKREVMQRDEYVCLTCGGLAICVNHVLGRKYKSLHNDPRYLISSCWVCNKSENADTVEARQQRIAILFEYYGYDYSDCPDKQYIEQITV